MSTLEGKVAVITGGASGIGEATAQLMVEHGASVIVADIQIDRGQALATSLGDRARFHRCDVAVEADIAAVVDLAISAHGRLDCMFNNAGIRGVDGPIDQIAAEDYDRSMAVLLRSVFLGAKHAARVMKPARSGVILSTTSIAGVQGGLGPHVYTTAKHAIVGLTKNLAAELGSFGIRANAIAPGATITPLSAESTVGDADDLAAVEALWQVSTPLAGRVGYARDIAHAALWLASDAAGYVSGQTVVVDGGKTTGSQPHGSATNF